MKLGDLFIGGVPGDVDATRQSAAVHTQRGADVVAARTELDHAVAGLEAQTSETATALKSALDAIRDEMDTQEWRSRNAAAALTWYADRLAAHKQNADTIRTKLNEFGDRLQREPWLVPIAEKTVIAAVIAYQVILFQARMDNGTAAARLDAAAKTDPATTTPDTRALTQDEIDAIKADITNPDWPDVTQHGIGDCYLIAGLEAMMRTPEGRAALQRNIRWDPARGCFVVTLHPPGGPPVDVYVTDVYANGANNNGPAGLVSVYEKALGQYLGYNDLNDGGNPLDTMSLITGKPGDRRSTSGDAYSQDDWDGIQSGLGANRPTVASTGGANFGTNPDGKPKGFVDVEATLPDGSNTTLQVVNGHAYTVERIEGDYIWLRNPWGTNSANGTAVSGSFRISRADFEKYYPWVETGSY